AAEVEAGAVERGRVGRENEEEAEGRDHSNEDSAPRGLRHGRTVVRSSAGIVMRAASPGLVAAVLLLAAAGCQSAAPPSDPPTSPTRPELVIAPIQIDSVVLVRGLKVPSGLGVHVQGIVGDGCSELLPLRHLPPP